jgi:pyruvate-formate lyase-activating enzyme
MKELTLVYCDDKGNVYDFPGKNAAFRSGRKIIPAEISDCIKLPFGTEIFSMPGRPPYHFDGRSPEPRIAGKTRGKIIDAASAFLPSGYLRTYLPAYEKRSGAKNLSLWAYAGIGLNGDDFYAPGFRIDDDVRSDPAIHMNDDECGKKIKEMIYQMPENRLVRQLARCAREYRCLCARNFFLGRYEAPVPTTPVCNADCLGCLSHQEGGSGFGQSQYRLDFSPDADEIAGVILRHFKNVPDGVASFGQGCEGEPLMRGNVLADAIRKVRTVTSEGTIHLNTNGSLPEMAERMIDAGLDSIRISLNSLTESYYHAYYKPNGYQFDDVIRTVRLSLDRGMFVSINLFFFPGFTDAESEVESLFRFLEAYHVHMIQTRNLNIDPDYYLDETGFVPTEPIGIRMLVDIVRRNYSSLKLGYYNPPKGKFGM